jgi:GTPase
LPRSVSRPSTANPTAPARERAFLIGIDRHSRRRSVPSQARSAAELAKTQGETASTADDENSSRNQRTSFTAEDSMAELRELATGAGAEITGEFLQSKSKPDPATLIGRGKLEEIACAASSSGAHLIIFDHDLTPSQQRNIEAEVSARVVDRT